MEASGAGLAAGDGAGNGNGDGQQGAGQQAGTDGQQGNGEQQQGGVGEAAIASLAERLDGLSSGQDEMRQFLAQQQAAQQQTQAQEQTPAADLSFLDESSPQYDPEKAAERLTEVVQEQARIEAQRLFAEQLAPVQERVSEIQMDREAETLIGEYPELGKAEVAQAVMDTATQVATQMGHPELVANAQFIKQTYLAGRALQLGQQQDGAAAGSQAATLEGASGASPGGAQQGATQAADAIGEKWAGRTNVLSKL